MDLRAVFTMSLAVTLLIAAPAARATDPDSDGFHATPRLGWKHGEHHVDLRFESRYRLESWQAFTSDFDTIHGFRTRLAAQYRYGNRFRLVAQGQHTAVLSLGQNTSGIAANYRDNSTNGRRSSVDGIALSQLFAEWTPADDSFVRVGREFVRAGTYVGYDESAWKFLKRSRVAQRLLGTVGWTNGERSYDGVNAFGRRNGHALHAFVLEPTTGVFQIEKAYQRNRDILVGGFDYTLERGTLREDTELGAFFIAYNDDRNPNKVAGLFGEIEVYTLGARALGIYEIGPGQLDVLLWGAFQFGDYADESPNGEVSNRDQRAGAALAEVGYQLPGIWGKPWLRLGVNYASGDDDRSDATRTTFFNILPTNHLYYGYLDQFAFQNLIDLLGQIRWRPHPKLSLDLTWHRFWLAEDADFRWVGTGAFSRTSLGYVRKGSQESTDVGNELDLTATVPLHKTTVLKTGYSHLWGGPVLGNDDADWFYFQIEVKY
jgi:hypothetical protein